MSNKRKLIREAFALHLSGKTAAEDRIYPNRIRHISTDELPLISVATTDESADVSGVAPRGYRRELTVLIECYAKDTDDVDDEIDNLLVEIENAIDSEDLFSLQQDVEEIYYIGSRVVKQGSEATQETAYATITYTVVYNTWAGAHLDDDADDYLRVHADFDGKASTSFDIEGNGP